MEPIALGGVPRSKKNANHGAELPRCGTAAVAGDGTPNMAIAAMLIRTARSVDRIGGL